jgi:hypothetical protein
MRMIDWRLRVLGLLAATLALAVPASASGAVTIGSDLAPDPDIAPGCTGIDACTVANFSHPGLQVSSPIDGVVVRWRVRARAGVAQGIRLKVVRSVGGGGYMGVSTSATRTIPVSVYETARDALYGIMPADSADDDPESADSLGSASTWRVSLS